MSRLDYYRRIFAAYLGGGNSQLTFWHERSEMNPDFVPGELGPYYMTFAGKADYAALHDAKGIPLLDYRGAIGPQYNPIAIAQYGLGNYNLYRRTKEQARLQRFLNVADWLVENLETNARGLCVWMHHFDFEYRDTLKAPWYSGLAQGQGLSVLARAFAQTSESRYREAAEAAFECFTRDIGDGGVSFTDAEGNPWFEEYIVFPPTHILNGFMWALWGVYDYALMTADAQAMELFHRGAETIAKKLPTYDTGYWSLYEHSGTKLPMVTSEFYHNLHIIQLRVMERLTGDRVFGEWAVRWDGYRKARWNVLRAKAEKVAFKLCNY